MIFRRALFIQLKMLGDILMLTPAIKAFKQKYPDSVLDIMVQPPGDQILNKNPYIDNIVLVEKPNWYSIFSQFKLIGKLRKNDYDLVIDFLGNPRSAHYTYLSGAGERVGYADARFTYAYNKTYKRTYDYSAKSKLEFLDFLGIENQNYKPEFYGNVDSESPLELRELNQSNLLAVSPVSLRSYKVWPTKNFAKITAELKNKYNIRPLVIVGPKERRFLTEFEKHADFEYTPLYIDNLSELATILKKCRLFLGNDNGPKHLAVAMGIPTFTIYSHLSDPVCWEYPDAKGHRFAGGYNQQGAMPINKISPDAVIKDVLAIIDELRLFEKS